MNANEKIEVKKLEIEPKEKGFKGWIKSKQVKKSIIAMLIGAVAGFAYFYFTEGQEIAAVPTGDIIQDVVFGAFLGFFFTNSPCSRGKC